MNTEIEKEVYSRLTEYIGKLTDMAKNDTDKVVCIHSSGAIKAILDNL